MKNIDFRSDTVTLPTDEMKEVMLQAPLGDDVYGEDPTVNRLEELVANTLGKEAALLLPSGTQSNLVALMSHCQRGDEYIVGQTAHCYRFEGGGAAVCGGIQPQPLAFRPDGTLDPEEVCEAIKPHDSHYARTSLVCLENTQAGRPVSAEYVERMRCLCDEHSLSLHMDGARLFNAASALDTSAEALAKPCDSISICLSKGLGAPAGSMLTGSRELIERARRWRKVLGGGMRQVGMLAAAGIYALENHVDRLAEDHRRATTLAEGLARYSELNVEISQGATNMVFCTPAPVLKQRYQEYLLQHGVKVGGYEALRFVTHLDIDDAAVSRVLDVTHAFFSDNQ